MATANAASPSSASEHVLSSKTPGEDVEHFPDASSSQDKIHNGISGPLSGSAATGIDGSPHSDEDLTFSPAEETDVLRRIDWNLVPYFSILYLLSFLDRVVSSYSLSPVVMKYTF